MGTFQLLRRVGAQAAFVETWAGLQQDKPVLLKRLEARVGLVERLGELTRGYRAPGMPAVLGVGLSGETPWLVVEGADGESLRWLMSTLARASGFIAPNEGLAVVAKVAEVLARLHAEGVVHGDVCPSTIFVTSRGEVQVHDVGLAALLGAQGELGPTRSEVNSLAPEQLTGPATPATDVFRLGLLLYELAIGRPLWTGPSPTHLCVAASSWAGLTRDKVKQVPEPWLTLLVTMLNTDANARPSMEEVCVVLEQAVQQNGWSASEAEVARLFSRAAHERPSAFTPTATAQELELSLSSTSARPSLTPSPGAVVARIATKKMTREALRVVRETLTGAEPQAQTLPADLKVALMLVERGWLTKQQLQLARDQAASSGESLFLCLVRGGADEDALISTLAEQTHTPSVSARKVIEAMPGPDALALVPLELSVALRAVPLGLKGGTQLMVAMAEPMDSDAVGKLKAAVQGKNVIVFRAGEKALGDARARLYPGATDAWAGGLQLEARDPLSLVGPAAALAPAAPATSQLQARVIEALLGLQGVRGTTALDLVGLAAGFATRLGLPEAEVTLARGAAQAMVTAALAANRLPHDVPKLLDVQELVGFGTEADAFVEALHAWPARMPERPVVKAVVLAFAFTAHVGEPRPKGSRLGGALNSFRARFQLAQPLFEVMTRELSG